MAKFTEQPFVLALLLMSSCIMAQTTTMEPTSVTSPPTTPPATHAPFPTAAVYPLPPEFSDIPREAVECWDSSIRYAVTSSFLSSEIQSAAVYTSYKYPTPITESFTQVYTFHGCTTRYPGLTTLCDGYPRASQCIEDCTETSHSTATYEFTSEGTSTWINPTWATELDELEPVTCTVAPDFSPECERVEEAYSWRMAQASANSTETTTEYHWSLRPSCSILVTPTASAKPKCSFMAGSYEAYYWTMSQPPDAFCSRNVTTPTPTPTMPTSRPSTTIISGLTMTSPYVYHVLHNVTIYTVRGHASLLGSGSDGSVLYEPLSSRSLVTLSQPSSSILSQTQECHKPSPRGATRCTISYHPDFVIQDLFTIDAKRYYGGELATPTTVTICQASYIPTVALALSDVMAQNMIQESCEWIWDHSLRTTVIGPDVARFSNFPPEAYHAITVGGEEKSSTTEPQSTHGTGSASITGPTPP